MSKEITVETMTAYDNDIDSHAESKEDSNSSSSLSRYQLQFCKELRDFYASHDFDLSGDIISCPYRYIRLNPRYDENETLDMLRKEVGIQAGDDEKETTANVLPVPWMESKWAFYALPEGFSLSKSPCFRSGRIYGMDVSSGAGVAVLLSDFHNVDASECKQQVPLDFDSELRVLDLCCSPGLKLLQMADCFHKKPSNTQKPRPVKVVGVDICEHRMNICKKIVQKYFIEETSGRGNAEESHVGIQLYREDGTTFGVQRPNLVFDSGVAMEEMVQRGGKRKRMNKSARAREKKRLRQIATTECGSATQRENSKSTKDENEVGNNIQLFDFVLVDAECSTDGSFKHIRQRLQEAQKKQQNKDAVRHEEENIMLTDPDKLTDLVELQRKLMASGFRLLKEGGALVYSTCSLSEDQNEKVVNWLLESHKDAALVPIHFPSIERSKFVTQGSLAGTVRFYPNLVQDNNSANMLLGDGFFVAKLKKGRKDI